MRPPAYKFLQIFENRATFIVLDQGPKITALFSAKSEFLLKSLPKI